jgi:ATP-binding cassette subfamily B protein
MSLALSSWPAERAGEALDALAHRAGLSRERGPAPASLPALVGLDVGALASRLGPVAARLSVDLEPVSIAHEEVPAFVDHGGPALVAADPGATRLIALLGRRQGSVLLLTPDGTLQQAPCASLCQELRRELERPVRAEVDDLLARAGVTGPRRELAARRLVDQRIGSQAAGHAVVVRLPSAAPVRTQLSHARAPAMLGAVVGVHALQLALSLGAWWLVGAAALSGHLDPGSLVAWLLLLASAGALRVLETALQGRISLAVGAIFRQQLLRGALALETSDARVRGAGQLLGRIFECQALESSALGGGMLALSGTVELVFAAAVLAAGAAGAAHAALLVAFSAAAAALTRGYWRCRLAWTTTRIGLTNVLVEKMLGHRTRLVQEPPDEHHAGEDELLGGYADDSRAADRAAVLWSALPRVWIVVGLLGCVPPFLLRSASPASLAVAIGGVLLAYQAFARLGLAMTSLTAALCAWQQVTPLLRSADRARAADRAPEGEPPSPAADAADVEACDLRLTYPGRASPVLEGCSLAIHPGDRILLEGPSGSGKSTLAMILAGLRHPDGGVRFVGGLDFETIGTRRWRQQVVLVPQFHDNYVLSETLAFNLLMGASWPPSEEELARAEALCRRLGLSRLLDSMPSGLLQLVGENGWQLSHGERSRLFLARGILQSPGLLILDESLSALDPETLDSVVSTVRSEVRTLMVIAHP